MDNINVIKNDDITIALVGLEFKTDNLSEDEQLEFVERFEAAIDVIASLCNKRNDVVAIRSFARNGTFVTGICTACTASFKVEDVLISAMGYMNKQPCYTKKHGKKKIIFETVNIDMTISEVIYFFNKIIHADDDSLM